MLLACAAGTARQYDEKNIRRRVYDALNVLMAMDIIMRQKKDIVWRGLPHNQVRLVAWACRCLPAASSSAKPRFTLLSGRLYSGQQLSARSEGGSRAEVCR